MRQIVLISDYGDGSIYTGLVKGLIYKITHKNNYLDFFNKVNRENLVNGAFLIENTHNSFDKDSVFCCNVDPNIYSDRDIIIVKKSNQFLVAPDNGILSSIVGEGTEIYRADMRAHIVEDKNMEITYLAAKISIGDMSVIGESLPKDSIKLIHYSAVESKDDIIGQVCHVDSFGNVITDIDNLCYESIYKIIIDDKTVYNFEKSYNESRNNLVFAYKGSLGKIEIAIKNKNAAKIINLKIGDRIIAKKKDD